MKVTKEIVVKFIEVGRVSPTSFGESFKNIYMAVKDTVEAGSPEVESDKNGPSKK